MYNADYTERLSVTVVNVSNIYLAINISLYAVCSEGGRLTVRGNRSLLIDIKDLRERGSFFYAFPEKVCRKVVCHLQLSVLVKQEHSGINGFINVCT